MENLNVGEIVETTVETFGEDVVENVTVQASSGFGKKAGVVGVLLLLAAGTYGAVKYYKAKKAKKDVDDINNVDVVDDFEA